MDDFELEKLRAEIQQEKQMKEMLEQSAAELRATVEELEKRYDTIDNEGNEWKTRYETQTEINEQLERQILMLQNKVQEAKANLKDGMYPRIPFMTMMSGCFNIRQVLYFLISLCFYFDFIKLVSNR